MLTYEHVYYQYNKLTERFITISFGSRQYDDSIHDLYRALFPLKSYSPVTNYHDIP